MIRISNVSGFNDWWLVQLNGINEGSFFWPRLCAASRRHTPSDPKCLSCLLFLTEAFARPFIWDFTAAHKKAE